MRRAWCVILGSLFCSVAAAAPTSVPDLALEEGATFEYRIVEAPSEGLRKEYLNWWTLDAVSQTHAVWILSSGDIARDREEGSYVVDLATREIVEAPSRDAVGTYFWLWLPQVRPGDTVRLHSWEASVAYDPSTETFSARVVAPDVGLSGANTYDADTRMLIAQRFDFHDGSRLTVDIESVTLAETAAVAEEPADGYALWYLAVVVEMIIFFTLYRAFRKRAALPPEPPAAFCTACGKGLPVAGSACPECMGAVPGVMA